MNARWQIRPMGIGGSLGFLRHRASVRKDREFWKLKVRNTVARLAQARRTLRSKPQKPDRRFSIFSTGRSTSLGSRHCYPQTIIRRFNIITVMFSLLPKLFLPDYVNIGKFCQNSAPGEGGEVKLFCNSGLHIIFQYAKPVWAID